MKKLFITAFAFLFSTQAWAECGKYDPNLGEWRQTSGIGEAVDVSKNRKVFGFCWEISDNRWDCADTGKALTTYQHQLEAKIDALLKKGGESVVRMSDNCNPETGGDGLNCTAEIAVMINGNLQEIGTIHGLMPGEDNAFRTCRWNSALIS